MFNALNAPNFGLSRGLHRQLHAEPLKCQLITSNHYDATTPSLAPGKPADWQWQSVASVSGNASETRCVLVIGLTVSNVKFINNEL